MADGKTYVAARSARDGTTRSGPISPRAVRIAKWRQRLRSLTRGIRHRLELWADAFPGTVLGPVQPPLSTLLAAQAGGPHKRASQRSEGGGATAPRPPPDFPCAAFLTRSPSRDSWPRSPGLLLSVRPEKPAVQESSVAARGLEKPHCPDAGPIGCPMSSAGRAIFG